MSHIVFTAVFVQSYFKNDGWYSNLPYNHRLTVMGSRFYICCWFALPGWCSWQFCLTYIVAVSRRMCAVFHETYLCMYVRMCMGLITMLKAVVGHFYACQWIPWFEYIYIYVVSYLIMTLLVAPKFSTSVDVVSLTSALGEPLMQFCMSVDQCRCLCQIVFLHIVNINLIGDSFTTMQI